MKNLQSMKRTFTFLIIFCFVSNYAIAQLTEVVSNFFYPTAVYKSGSYLYYGSHSGSLFVKNIDNGGAAETVINSSGIYRVAVQNNTMYISHSTISNVDIVNITDNTPVNIGSITGLYNPSGIAVKDNYLYVCEWTLNQIVKVDISDPNYSREVIADGLSGPAGITIHNEKLYICEFDGNKVSTLNISEDEPELETLVEGLLAPTEIIALSENELLVSEFNSDKVVKIDISDTLPEVEDFVTGIQSPTGLFKENQDLYISSYYEDKIYAYNIPDFTPPVCNTQNISIELNESGITTLTANDIDFGSYDENEIDSMYLDVYTFDNSNIGENNITLFVVDASGNTSSCTAIVTVEELVSINDTNKIELELKPNPVNNFLYVNISKNIGVKFISLTDSQGKVLIKQKTDRLEKFDEKLDMTKLPKGIYILKIHSQNSDIVKKVMKF